MSKLHVKGQVDYVDLRKITAQGKFLSFLLRKHGLEHLQCVVFTNNHRYKPRFRVVINLYGEPFLAIPAVDDVGKHSTYLRISEFLAKYAGLEDTRIELKKLAVEAGERIKRRNKKRKK